MKKAIAFILILIFFLAGCIVEKKGTDEDPIITPPENGNTTPPDTNESTLDECSDSVACNDKDSCTRDVCAGEPKRCSNVKVTNCTNGDGCCPGHCTPQFDNDCTTDDECQTNTDCNDGRSTTIDSCTGTPKKCSYRTKNCFERGGKICSIVSECNESIIKTVDTNECCVGSCKAIDLCSDDSDCNDDYSCTEDICFGEPRVCLNLEMFICENDDNCCPFACDASNDNDCS